MINYNSAADDDYWLYYKWNNTIEKTVVLNFLPSSIFFSIQASPSPFANVIGLLCLSRNYDNQHVSKIPWLHLMSFHLINLNRNRWMRSPNDLRIIIVIIIVINIIIVIIIVTIITILTSCLAISGTSWATAPLTLKFKPRSPKPFLWVAQIIWLSNINMIREAVQY